VRRELPKKKIRTNAMDRKEQQQQQQQQSNHLTFFAQKDRKTTQQQNNHFTLDRAVLEAKNYTLAIWPMRKLKVLYTALKKIKVTG
jgi:hypothetical protein